MKKNLLENQEPCTPQRQHLDAIKSVYFTSF